MHRIFSYIALLVTSLIFSSGCTKYEVIKTPADTDENNNKEVAYKLLMNKKWKQLYVQNEYGGKINDGAALEFTDIKDERANRYIIKIDSNPAGFYLLIDEYTLFFEWETGINHFNDEMMYGKSGVYKCDISESKFHYGRIENNHSVDYYYTYEE